MNRSAPTWLENAQRYNKFDHRLKQLQIKADKIARFQIKSHIPVPITCFKRFGLVKSFGSEDIGIVDDASWVRAIWVENVHDHQAHIVIILIPSGFPSLPSKDPIVFTIGRPPETWVDDIVNAYILQENTWQKAQR